ncbi:MAG: hypothetical protein U0800_27415, partial [Isosphaeraceae bacterium]
EHHAHEHAGLPPTPTPPSPTDPHANPPGCHALVPVGMLAQPQAPTDPSADQLDEEEHAHEDEGVPPRNDPPTITIPPEANPWAAMGIDFTHGLVRVGFTKAQFRERLEAIAGLPGHEGIDLERAVERFHSLFTCEGDEGEGPLSPENPGSPPPDVPP